MKRILYLFALFIALGTTESAHGMRRFMQATKPFTRTLVRKVHKPLATMSNKLKTNPRATLFLAGLIAGTGITAHQMEEKWRVHKEDLENTNKSDELELISKKIALHIEQYSPQEILEFLDSERSYNHPSVIMSAVAANIDTFLYTWDAKNLLNILWRCNGQNKQLIAKAIANNIDEFLNMWEPWEITELLPACDEQNRQVIYSAISRNIDSLLYKWNVDIISTILEKCDTQNRHRISTAIVVNIIPLSKKIDEHGISILLKKCIPDDRQVAATTLLTKNLCSILDTWHYEYIEAVLSFCSIDDQEAIKKNVALEAKNILLGHGISQSDSHLEENAIAAWQYIKVLRDNPEYKAVFQEALNHERAIAKDSAVFYHSQKSPIFWAELLYTKFWERKYNQKIYNYLFTRFPDDHSIKTQARAYHDGDLMRKELLEYGRTRADFYTQGSFLFFTNYALFGNSRNYKSSTANFFIHDKNYSTPCFLSKHIFDNFSKQPLYQQYISEINALEEEFKDIVPSSILLQVALPYDILNDYVYLAINSGFKKKLSIHGKPTDDVSTILETLKTNPKAIGDLPDSKYADHSDVQEFCIIMTPDAMHTLHEKGAQIHYYGTYDKDKLNQLITKLEMLIDRIVTENPNAF